MAPSIFALVLVFIIQGVGQKMFDEFSYSNQTLIQKASRILEEEYLGIFLGEGEGKQQVYNGRFFGLDRRAFVSIPIKLSHKSCPQIRTNVIFLVDNGAATSTLRYDTLVKLFENCPQIESTFSSFYKINILGYQLKVIKSQLQYEHFNLLGADFFKKVYAIIQADYASKIDQGSFTLQLGASKFKQLQGKSQI